MHGPMYIKYFLSFFDTENSLPYAQKPAVAPAVNRIYLFQTVDLFYNILLRISLPSVGPSSVPFSFRD